MVYKLSEDMVYNTEGVTRERSPKNLINNSTKVAKDNRAFSHREDRATLESDPSAR